MSADGNRLAACVGFGGSSLTGDIYTSGDSGATWTDLTAAGTREWQSVAMSDDGNHLLAAVNSDTVTGDLFTSDDAGATWLDRTALGKQHWGSVALSSNGGYLAACDGYSILIGHF